MSCLTIVSNDIVCRKALSLGVGKPEKTEEVTHASVYCSEMLSLESGLCWNPSTGLHLTQKSHY